MIESGRRMGSDSSQVTWAKLPGRAWAAHFGDRTRTMYWSPGYSRTSSTSPSSTKMVPRWARSAWGAAAVCVSVLMPPRILSPCGAAAARSAAGEPLLCDDAGGQAVDVRLAHAAPAGAAASFGGQTGPGLGGRELLVHQFHRDTEGREPPPEALQGLLQCRGLSRRERHA